MDDFFTGQSPGNAISIPAAPDVHEELGQSFTSKPQLRRGGLGDGWWAGARHLSPGD